MTCKFYHFGPCTRPPIPPCIWIASVLLGILAAYVLGFAFPPNSSERSWVFLAIDILALSILFIGLPWLIRNDSLK